MPRRSNAFQRFIRVLRQHCAPQGLTAEESALLRDEHTGQLREVDILITPPAASAEPFYTSIECIDHARPATVPWVEQMWAKHASLPTTELWLASRSGFYATAAAKAEALGLGIISYEEDVPPDLALQVIGQGGQLWVKQPEIDEPTRFELALETSTLGFWSPQPPGVVLTNERGEDAIVAAELALAVLDEAIPRIRARSPFTELDVVEHHHVEGVVPAEMRPLYLVDPQRRISPEVVAYRATFPVVIRSRLVSVREAMVDGVPSAAGRFGFDDDRRMLVMTEPADDSPRISIVSEPG